jgi:hypothetical protein
MVEAFVSDNPKATRLEWMEFSVGLAEEFYRSAYERGFEFAERDLDRKPGLNDPEVAAFNEQHEWTWTAGGPLPPGDDEVPDE